MEDNGDQSANQTVYRSPKVVSNISEIPIDPPEPRVESTIGNSQEVNSPIKSREKMCSDKDNTLFYFSIVFIIISAGAFVFYLVISMDWI